MNSFNDYVPGATGAILNTYIGHPFDTIRVRMQDVNNIYSSSFDCLKKTYRYEGISGIYKGSISSLLAIMIENSIVFATNDILKRHLNNVNGKTSTTLHNDIMIGGISGLCATIGSCPFETIKCNMQINKKYCSIFDIHKEYKITGLYNGFTASCFRNIPYYFLFFPFYTRYIDIISTISRKKSLNILEYSLAGGLSASTSWSIIYPLDVIKCNQQLQSKKTTIRSMAMKLYRAKGIKGLYAGFLPTILRSFPANFALLFGIELSNKWLVHGAK